MSARDDFRDATARVLDREEVEGVLSAGTQREALLALSGKDLFPVQVKASGGKVAQAGSLKRLDEMVDKLKAKGLTKANRSALIRYALNGVDLESVPKGL